MAPTFDTFTDLSKIEISKKERKAFDEQLERIISYVSSVEKKDTRSFDTTPPCTNVFREDTVTTRRGQWSDILLEQVVSREGKWVKVSLYDLLKNK